MSEEKSTLNEEKNQTEYLQVNSEIIGYSHLEETINIVCPEINSKQNKNENSQEKIENEFKTTKTKTTPNKGVSIDIEKMENKIPNPIECISLNLRDSAEKKENQAESNKKKTKPNTILSEKKNDNSQNYSILKSEFSENCSNLNNNLSYFQSNSSDKKILNLIKEFKKGDSMSSIKVCYDPSNFHMYAVKKLDINAKNIALRSNEIFNCDMINKFNSKLFLKTYYYSLDRPKINKSEGQINLFLELCDGSLKDYQNFLEKKKVNKKIKISDEELKHLFLSIFLIFKDILDGLQILHSKKIVHSDIKPANIFISHTNSPMKFSIKIADFETLISWDEYKKNNIFYGYTKGFVPCDINGNLLYPKSEEEFFKLDIFALGKTMEMIIKTIKKILDLKMQKICQRLLDEIISQMIFKNYELLISLNDCQLSLERFLESLNKEGFSLKDEKLHIFPEFLIEILTEKFDKNFVAEYINIGFYDVPIKFFLRNEKNQNAMITLAKLYSYERNNDLSFYYYNEFLNSIKDDKNSENLKLFAESACAHIKFQMGTKDDKEFAKEKMNYLLKRINIEEMDFSTFYAQETITNIIYLFIEFARKEDPYTDLFQRVYKKLENDEITPNYSTKTENECFEITSNYLEPNKINYFFYVLFNINSLYNSYMDCGKGKESVELSKKSIDLAKTVYIENTVQIAQLYNNCGVAHQDCFEYEEAFKMHEKSYIIRKKMTERSSEFNLSFVYIPYLNMAKCLMKMGKVEEAEPIIKEIYEYRSKFLVEENRERIQATDIYASALRKLNKFDEAEKLIINCIKVMINESNSFRSFNQEYFKKCLDDLSLQRKAYEESKKE